MDVDQIAFPWQLPLILKAVANAHFVALDLELSGIHSKPLHRNKVDHGHKQSLQERYEETKEAAERYQVLQVGLTVVREDRERGVYNARPYNFFLNPILTERMDIERIFSYQSGAVEFLLGHGFRMEAPFLHGVNYLSREEQELALQMELARANKDSIADIHLRSDEVEALSFVRKVREQIEDWKNQKTTSSEFLNVSAEGYSAMNSTDRGLNGYQRRLVHQLVRAEYPDFVTVSRSGFIQIIAYDKRREDAIKVSKMKVFEGKLARQVGLRWVVEAMAGGNLDPIDPVSFIQPEDDKPIWVDVKKVNAEFQELKDQLAKKRTVLVGHNVFMDLINFYKCFFGKLPDRVEDFSAIMHRLFPLIVDTKYMATHQSTELNARSGLDELDLDLAKLPIPAIETHHLNDKYTNYTPAHEAGFDSFMTAKVLIRLSAKLEATGHYIEAASSHRARHASTLSNDDGGVSIPLTDGISYSNTSSTMTNRPNGHKHSDSDSSSQGVPLHAPNGSSVSTDAKPHSKKKKKCRKLEKQHKTAFSHAGKFDLLGSMVEDAEEGTVEVEAKTTTKTPVVFKTFTSASANSKAKEADPAPSRLMPPWDSDFWNIYGNKLRINGTIEGVCELTGGSR